MAEKSKILVIGGTGNFGKFVIEASAKAGHPTFALIREGTASNSEKAKIIDDFKNQGVNLVYGDLYDHGSLEKAIKGVDVVISTVGRSQVADQVNIIAAIKEAGNVKRFIPSEFGADPDKAQIDPDNMYYAKKSQIRRIIEKEGIPHTCISCNFFIEFLLPSLVQPGLKNPPRDKVMIFGDGNTRAVFMKKSDVATFTICAVDDPRTLNRVLYLRPPGNVYSMNELVELWEVKIANKLEKVYISEEQLLKRIEETKFPINLELMFIQSAFVKGHHTYFDIGPRGVNGTELYPHVKYTTVSEYLDTLL